MATSYGHGRILCGFSIFIACQSKMSQGFRFISFETPVFCPSLSAGWRRGTLSTERDEKPAERVAFALRPGRGSKPASTMAQGVLALGER